MIASIPKKQDFGLYLIRNPDISWTQLSNQIALVNIQSSSFYTLNETGALVWSLANRRTLAETEDALSGEYDVPEQDIRKDIWALACKLVKQGLASFSQKPSPTSK